MAAPVRAAVVTSPAPDHSAVTLYRDPDRGAGEIDREWPTGFALVTETRTVHIPAGASVLRFEGVADGMLPESAIVTGLPGGVREKNRDARLLSPSALIEANLTRRVRIVRTNRKTGAVREEEAILRAGPGNGVILQTAEGVEALGCSGLPERLSYDAVPEGLSAKPTLSVLTEARTPVTATVRLSYLAQGFDWGASYVAQVAADGRTLDLFAWVTIASGASVSFPQADLQAVAGRLNRTQSYFPRVPAPPPVNLTCWPSETTSTPHFLPEPQGGLEDIVVTGSRRAMPLAMMAPAPPPPPPMMAKQEELGDLKLYRIPERVTLAAQSQKQVAMLTKARVPFERIYRGDFYARQTGARPLRITLRMRNLAAKGLGLPLPAGHAVVFEQAGGTRQYVGEDDLADRAVGEKVEIAAGDAPDVRLAVRPDPADPKAASRGYVLKLTNARTIPAAAEVKFPDLLDRRPPGVVREDGRDLWRVTIPAGGTATLRVGVKQRER